MVALRAPISCSPYEAVLGLTFASLHAHVRRAHLAPLRAEGTMDVEHGPGWLTAPMIWLMKLPAAGLRQQVRLDVAQDGPELVWTRRIGRSVLKTRQRANGSRLVERLGLARVSFDLAVEGGALLYEQSSINLAGVLLPSSLSPRVGAVVSPTTEGWRVVVTVKWRGRIVCRYAGTIRAVWRTAIWLLLLQASLGAFDTLYYHEYRLKLAHSVHTRMELRLHASRDFAYAIIIGSLGFVTWHGAFAWVLLGLLLGEICITLWDFIEEDKIRRLPAGERAMHAVMGIVYGAFLAFLIPQMIEWSSLATGFGHSYHGFPAWLLLVLAAGVFASGVRDLIASARPVAA